jgi:hypothetical protein
MCAVQSLGGLVCKLQAAKQDIRNSQSAASCTIVEVVHSQRDVLVLFLQDYAMPTEGAAAFEAAPPPPMADFIPPSTDFASGY